MTPRRASALGASLRQQLAGSRSRGRAVALAGSALFFAAATLPAATHATHTRHASESAGKVPAHAVHDTVHGAVHETGARAGYGPTKPSHGHPPAAAPRKGSSAATHASQPHTGATGKHNAETHSGRKHHELPPDDPPLRYRAKTDRPGRDSREAFAEDSPAYGNTSAHRNGTAAPRTAHALATPAGRPLPTRQTPAHAANARIDSGFTVNDFLRDTHHHVASANAGTAAVSNPAGDTDALPAIDSTEPERAAADARAGTAAAVVVGKALSQSAPPTQVVEGFGAEVDFRTPAARAARAPAVVLPRESPAEQERDLRAAAEIAAQPMFVPLYARDGQLIVPPPLKGSRDILVHQNQMADDAGLTRIQDDADLERLRRTHLLVDLPESVSLHINEALPENRRSARPWTVKFAVDIAHAFYARFGEPLQINSAVRTVAYQLRLQRVNGNAAAVEGEGASPHLTGQAIDFGKRGMSVAEIAWMRSYLLPLIDAGKIDVEEEFQQACFHISVYAGYAPALRMHTPAKTEVAQVNKTTHTHPTADADETLH